jgi:yecA family protein
MSARAWLPLIWGEAEPEWLDEDEARQVRAAAHARHEQVARQLPDDPDSYVPILRTLPDGTVTADDWARGFQAGIGLHAHDWDALYRNPKAKRFMVPITAQLPDWDDRIMADCGRDAVLTFRSKGRELIGYCVAEIGRFWARRRQASSTRQDADRQPRLI